MGESGGVLQQYKELFIKKLGLLIKKKIKIKNKIKLHYIPLAFLFKKPYTVI